MNKPIIAFAACTLMACASDPKEPEQAEPLVQQVSIPAGTAGPAGEHEIPGVLTLPGGDIADVPAVLMLHGFGSQKDEVGNFYIQAANALAIRGIGSLRIDFPCAGASTLPCTANTIDIQVQDARAALEYLRAHGSVDTSQIGILGFSLGGIVAATVAGTDGNVWALALWSTPGDTAAAFDDLYQRYYEEAASNGSVVADLGFRTIELSKEFFDSTRTSFPLMDIQGYPGPLVVIAGENDAPMPADAELYASSIGGGAATVHIIPGADHIYGVLSEDKSKAQEVVELTADWFASSKR